MYTSILALCHAFHTLYQGCRVGAGVRFARSRRFLGGAGVGFRRSL